MKVFLSEKASADLLDIYRYVAEHDLRAAEAITRNLDEKLQHLKKFPFLGRERNSLTMGLRSLVLDEYVIFYVLEKSHITIVRILHSRMDVDLEFQR